MSKVVHWFDENGKPIRYDTIRDFAEAQNVTYKTALDWIRVGYNEVMRRQENGRSRKNRTIVAARPKLQPKVNENCIVRIRHFELDKMLNYVAKTTKTTYQAVFEEFVILIYEQHRVWGQETITLLKERMAQRARNGNGNGYHENHEDNAVLVMPEEKRGKAMELLAVAIEENDALREENESLKDKNLQLENVIRRFRNLMQEVGE